MPGVFERGVWDSGEKSAFIADRKGEWFFFEVITSDRKVKASRESSNCRFYGTKKTAREEFGIQEIKCVYCGSDATTHFVRHGLV